MTQIREFHPIDIVALDQQDSQRGQLGIWEPQVSLRHGGELAAMGPAYTAIDRQGRVMACAGLAEVFGDRQATAWALFARGWWQALDRKVVLRALRAGLASSPYARVEALARMAHVGECRLLEAVGFTMRCELAQWGPNSESVVLFDHLGPARESEG